MAKIIVEVSEELKKRFIIECAKQGHTQRSVIAYLIDKWMGRKRGA